MNPTNRFQRVMAAVLVCALFGAIAVFRARGQAVAEPGSRSDEVEARPKPKAATESDPPAAIPPSDAAPSTGSRPATAADAISQLAKSVVTIVKVDRGMRSKKRPDARIQAGVVIDPRGYILTLRLDDDEEKVAPEEQQFVVRFSNQNQEEYPAELVENDRLWGLALLKIEAHRPLPAISFKNIREPVSKGAVVLVPSVPRKKPFKGRITATGILLAVESPYSLIKSNIRLPEGEAGSLLVTSGGNPIAMMINQADTMANQAGIESSYAIPLTAILDFIRSDETLEEVLGHLTQNAAHISTKEPVPTPTAAPATEARPTTAGDAISQLSKSVVTIAKVVPATKDRNVPDTRIQAGVIIDPRGYVLTLQFDDDDEKRIDAKEKQQLVVRLSNQDQQEYPAEVIENDRLWGLALLKIEATQPFPAISFKNVREPYSNCAVLLVPSVPRKKNPVKGLITSPRLALTHPSAYSLVESNLRLPDGDAGSLLVTSHGEPIGIMMGSRADEADRGSSYAVPLEAVLAFIDSDPTLQEVLGHLAPNPPPTPTKEPVPPPTAPPAKDVRTPAAAEAISQLAKSVVTIAKLEPATKDRNVPDTRIQAGIIIDPRGYVLTVRFNDDEKQDNDANEKQQLVVRLSNQDQQEYPAEVIENDRFWYMAVLKIEAAQPLPAVSLKNRREPTLRSSVRVVPSVPQKKPVKGWITSTGIREMASSPYRMIVSDLHLPAGEAGSLLVTGRGDPIGMMTNQYVSGDSYAIPWEAVLDFIRADDALQEVLGHLAENPLPDTRPREQADDELMEPPLVRKRVLGELREPSLSGKWFTDDPAAKGKLVFHRVENKPGEYVSDPEAVHVKWHPETDRFEGTLSGFQPHIAGRIGIDVLADGNILMQLKELEDPDGNRTEEQVENIAGSIKQEWTRAAPDNEQDYQFYGTATVFRVLRPNPARQTTSVPRTRGPSPAAPARDSEFSLPSAPPVAARRSPSPYDSAPPTLIYGTPVFGPPVPLGRHIRAVTDSPAEQKLIEQLESRESAATELAAKVRTLQGNGPGERNQPAIDDAQRELKSQLSAAFDLKLQLEELQVKELQSRLSRLERQIGQRRALRDKIIARRAAQLVEDKGLQWDTSSTSPQSPPPTHNVFSEWQTPTPASSPAPSPAVVKRLQRRAGLLVDGMLAGKVKPATVLVALEELRRIEPPPPAEWLNLLETMLEAAEKLYAAGQLPKAELLQIEAACDAARSANEKAGLPPKRDSFPPTKTDRAARLKGWTQVRLSGPANMRVSFGVHNDDLITNPTYSIQRRAEGIERTPLIIQSTAGSKNSIGGQLDIYPTDSNDPEADEFLQNNAVPFQISEQDMRKVSAGVGVTKLVVMSFQVSLPDKNIQKVELETLDSSMFPEQNDLFEEAARHGTIVAVLTLSQRFAAAVDPAPKPGSPSNTSSKRLKGTEDSSAEQPPTSKPVSVSRVFPLRFKLASEMVDDLRQILLGREGHDAKPSVDNQEILVISPPETMERVQTFISVMDWPDEITRGINFEYSRESVIRSARSFFYACAIEDDPDAFSKLLSLHILADLKGDTKSDAFQKYIFGGTPDPEWEQALRGDWPGKKEAIRRFVGEWNKYPLKRITEGDGVAIGFGAKYFCSVSFTGAPKEFYQVTIAPDRTRGEGDKPLYVFSSLPPWWKSENRTDAAKTDEGDIFERIAGLRISVDKTRATLEGKSDEDAELMLRIGSEQDKLKWTSRIGNGNAFKAIVELSDKIKLDGGSFGSGLVFSVHAGAAESTSNIHIPRTGPLPSGRLKFRNPDQVMQKDGVLTFADLYNDDGKLLPVSILVETKR